MFCPNCGLEESQSNQFCRACGADLRPVRAALARPDVITESAASARDEIGRAIAAKIRETQTISELKNVAEDVLPEIEKFLESPEEKRLRRVRGGTIVAAIGLSAAIAFSLVNLLSSREGMFVLIAAAGLIAFFIGLSLVVNGLLFTVPKKTLSDESPNAERQRELDAAAEHSTNDLVLPPTSDVFSSVTENTTHRLKEKQPILRRG